ncbi:MAG: phosphonopyruvate decarboxylase [Verrucomicrobiae bacterium]|nr:phosphonopyruvate decarboxylase [Verrucomicrobiae bacterium]
MIEASQFIGHLQELGYSQYAGVPCSFLKPFINCVIDDPALDYLGSASEGEAVGITMGAHLAGRKTVTMCQNSGLGNMVNPLTSLNYPFRIPTLLITTWRGQPGVKDEPQHEQMGRITKALLDAIEIPSLPFPTETEQIAPTMSAAEAHMAASGRPFALIMAKDSVAPQKLQSVPSPIRVDCESAMKPFGPEGERLNRSGALTAILENLVGNEAIIATTGMTGRELFTIADRENHLYVVGGMGTASGIGLGLAHALPDQPTLVIDGDGAALMKLGALASIGHYQPRNLLHIILDNERHDSTGGQATVSSTTRFAEIAAACNYRRAIATDSARDLPEIVRKLRESDGPSLLHVKIKPGNPDKIGRPTVTPVEVKERFMDFLRGRTGVVSQTSRPRL